MILREVLRAKVTFEQLIWALIVLLLVAFIFFLLWGETAAGRGWT